MSKSRAHLQRVLAVAGRTITTTAATTTVTTTTTTTVCRVSHPYRHDAPSTGQTMHRRPDAYDVSCVFASTPMHEAAAKRAYYWACIGLEVTD